jgi:hypothetical protein
MAKTFTNIKNGIEVFGVETTIKNLERYAEKTVSDIESSLNVSANKIASKAKANAITNGYENTASTIHAEPAVDGAEVKVDSPIAAYLEWGTGSKVRIEDDPELRKYEKTFEWPGVTKHPIEGNAYLFPAVWDEVPDLEADIVRILNEIP